MPTAPAAFDAKSHLADWFNAILLSGRNHRMLTRVVEQLNEQGVGASYETLAKARRGLIPLPSKYILPLAALFHLTDAETRHFAIAAVLAHVPAELAEQMVSGGQTPAAPHLRN